MRFPVLAIASLGIVLVLSSGLAEGSGDTGTIIGTVFHDQNADGVMASSEDGLTGFTIELSDENHTIDSVTSASGGSYILTEIPAGAYTVNITPEREIEHSALKSTRFFDPIPALDGVSEGVEPWGGTPPESVSLTVGPGESRQADFGLERHGDSVIGTAVIQGDYVPDGTAIEAWYEGTVCGTTTVDGDMGFFRLQFFNERSQAGCATEGYSWLVHMVKYTVGTLPCCTSDLSRHDPVWLSDDAWYWASASASRIGSLVGESIEARIGGTVCGTAILEKSPLPEDEEVGFARMIVPSFSIAPGCGAFGKEIEFVIGEDVIFTGTWDRRVLQAELRNTPPSPTPGSVPTTGGPAGSSAELPVTALTAMLVGGTALALTGALLVGRRRLNG